MNPFPFSLSTSVRSSISTLTFLLITGALTACGGGSGTPLPNPGGGGETSTPGPGAQNPTPNPSPTPGDDDNDEVTDQQLNGDLHIASNQVIFTQWNRPFFYDTSRPEGTYYNASPIDFFEGNYDGNFTYLDMATGLTEEERNDPRFDDRSDVGFEAPWRFRPEIASPAAPIANFGFRMLTELRTDTDEIQTGAQSAVGRVAFELVERPSGTGSPAGQTLEQMKFIIDRVELVTNEAGTLVSARAQPGAQVYVSGVNAQGTVVNATIPAPANSLRVMSMADVADAFNDPTSQVLFIDLEQAFSQAGEELAALHNLRGYFDLHVTMSSLNMVRPTKDDLPRRELVGKSIQVRNLPPVTGAGVSGVVTIRMQPL